MSCNWHISDQDYCLVDLVFYIRLREYEVVVDSATRRGPEVERISFVILEMARKCCLTCVQISINCIFMRLNTIISQHISEHCGILYLDFFLFHFILSLVLWLFMLSFILYLLINSIIKDDDENWASFVLWCGYDGCSCDLRRL